MDVFRVESDSFDRHNQILIWGLLCISVLISVLLELSLMEIGVQLFISVIISIIVKKSYLSVVLEIKDDTIFFSNGVVLYWKLKEKHIKSVRKEGKYLVFYTVDDNSYSINYNAFTRQQWDKIEAKLTHEFLSDQCEAYPSNH